MKNCAGRATEWTEKDLENDQSIETFMRLVNENRGKCDEWSDGGTNLGMKLNNHKIEHFILIKFLA